MTRTALAPLITPDFEMFLAAAVGVEPNGGALSVLSALARLDVDPWREAKTLAGLPTEGAKARLLKLLMALPGTPMVGVAADTIAAELIALLPRGKPAAAPAPLTLDAGNYAMGYGLVGLLGLLALLLLNMAPSSGVNPGAPAKLARPLSADAAKP